MDTAPHTVETLLSSALDHRPLSRSTNLMLDVPHPSRASPDHRPINLHPNLDAATGVFIEDIKRRLASTRDLSEQLSHENRKLRASGAYSSVFVTLWAPPDSHPRQVSPSSLLLRILVQFSASR